MRRRKGRKTPHNFSQPLQRELLLDLGNGETRVKTLRAGSRAVENGVASVQAHRVVERGLALSNLLVTRIGEPSVRLEENGGSKVFFSVPPVRRARSGAAGTENTLVKTIKLLAVGNALSVFTTLIWKS
jgi:hypothetical protein